MSPQDRKKIEQNSSGSAFIAANNDYIYIYCNNNSIYKRIIRAISTILIIVFSWQQVTWAQGGATPQPVKPAIDPRYKRTSPYPKTRPSQKRSVSRALMKS